MTHRRWILSSTPINAPDYIPPPHYSSPGHRRLVNAFLAAVSVTVFLSFLLLTYYIIFIRRHRNNLPSVNPFPPAPSNVDYHVTWLVRTVGLNDTSINSIPLKPYISGSHSGAADCTVCLIEFRDRDPVRYLPGCDHAFHVNCIDTWLRSHVSCPLCRANIEPGERVAVSIDDLIIHERSGSLDLREEGRREIEADVSPDCGESCSSSFAGSGLMPELRSKSMDSLR